MTEAFQIPNAPEDVDALVSGHGRDLSAKLRDHWVAHFPPKAQKTLRSFQLSEVAHLLGVKTGYLRNLSLEGKGPEPAVTPSGRRSYTAEQILELRKYLDENARAKKRYLPHRRDNEHLQIIAVANFKGGSGKTTTAAHLAQHLALSGHRVLAIDLDPQASLTALHGFQPEFEVGPNETLYGAIRYDEERRPMHEIIRPTNFPGLDLIPASSELADFEYDTPVALNTQGTAATTFFTKLEVAIGEVADQYDIVVLDCPPQLGYLTMIALCAATGLLVTVHPQMLDVMSMSQFLQMLGDIMFRLKQVGARLNFDWVRYLITRFEASDLPQTEMSTFIRSQFGRHVLVSPMLKSVAISDAGLTKQTLYEVERKEFTPATYDRAMEALDVVNGEIQALIHRTWGRG